MATSTTSTMAAASAASSSSPTSTSPVDDILANNSHLFTFGAYSIAITIISLLYFFHVNRIFAKAVSSVACFYLWQRRKIWIAVDSLAFLPLTGKIMFKGFRYKSRNMSIHILRGHITFRYWLPRVREDFTDKGRESTLPCRIKIRLDGFEWFIYNRSEAYDYISQLLARERGASPPDVLPKDSERRSGDCHNGNDDGRRSKDGERPSQSRRADFLSRWLPLEIVGTKGAISIGNNDLPTMIIAHYSKMTGTFGLEKPKSSLDTGRSYLSAKLSDCKINYRQNHDYREPRLNQAARQRQASAQRLRPKRGWFPWFRKRSGDDIEMRDILDDGWAGLPRYNVGEDDNPLSARGAIDEYARNDEFVSTDLLSLYYYVEEAGYVEAEGDESAEDPQWGIELGLSDANIWYGPWTARQRSMLLDYLFPSSFRNSEPRERLGIGSQRLFSAFQLRIFLTGKATIRIPFREESKNWKYTDVANEATRTPGWIDVKLKGDSSLDISLPILAGAHGYESSLRAFLSDATLESSLNYSEMLSAKCIEIQGDIPSPLKWNSERQWKFTIAVSDSRAFLLRDHITMIQDLIKDFSSGPPVEAAFFVPIAYEFKFDFRNLECMLCVNQNNIIYQANDFAENTFQIVQVESAAISLDIPLYLFEPVTNVVSFAVEACKGKARMSFPACHTVAAFSTPDALDVGVIESIRLTGSYEYFREISALATDVLNLDIEASRTSFKLYGHLIRAFIYLAGNYFGDFTSSITNEEYKFRVADRERYNRYISKKNALKSPENEFELRLRVKANDAAIILPENMYSCRNALVVRVGEGYLYNVNNSYTHTLDISVGAARVEHLTMFNGDYMALLDRLTEDPNNFVQVDGVDVSCVRLFGPKPDYHCYAADWRLSTETITGAVQPSFLIGALSAVESFVLHFSDQEDHLPFDPDFPEVDTFHITTKPIKVSVLGQDSISSISLSQGFEFHWDNFIRASWTSRLVANVPNLSVSSLVFTGEEYNAQSFAEVFSFESSPSVALYSRSPDLEKLRRAQRKFVIEEDLLTGRFSNTLLACEGDLDARDRLSLYPQAKLNPAFAEFIPPFPLIPASRANGRNGKRRGSHYRAQTETSNFSFKDWRNVESAKWASTTGTTHRGRNSTSPPSLGFSSASSVPYKSFLRQYSFHSGNHLFSFSESSDFLRSSDSRPNGLYASGFGNEREDSDPLKFANSKNGSTILSFHDRTGIKIVCTPLMLNVLKSFFESTGGTDELETVLDRIQRNYTNSVLAEKTPSTPGSFCLTASVPVVQVVSIQDMFLPKEATFLTDDNLLFPSRHSDAALCSAELIVEDIRTSLYLDMKADRSGATKFSDVKLSADVQTVKANMRYLGDLRDVGIVGIPSSMHHFTSSRLLDTPIVSSSPIVLDIYVSGLSAVGVMEQKSSVKDSILAVKCDVDELNVVTVNQSGEIAFGAASTWTNIYRELQRISIRLARERDRREEELIYAIIGASRALQLSAVTRSSVPGDPLFLVVPSSTWLLGSNRVHQKDRGWKLMCHIRHCYKTLGVPAVSQFLTDQVELKSFNSKAMLQKVVQWLSKWRSWENQPISESKFLHAVFIRAQKPAGVDLSSREVSVLLNSHVSCVMRKFLVTIFEPEAEDNVLNISPLKFDLDSRLQDRVKVGTLPKSVKTGNSGQLVPGRAPSNSGNTQTVDLKARLSVQDVLVSLNINVFRLVRHILRVYTWFAPELQPSGGVASSSSSPAQHTVGPIRDQSSKESSSPPTKVSTRFQFSSSFRAISVSAAAHNLDLRVKLVDSFVTYAWYNQTFRELTAAGGVDAVGSPLVASDDKLAQSFIWGASSITTTLSERVSRNGNAGMGNGDLKKLAGLKLGGASGLITSFEKRSMGVLPALSGTFETAVTVAVEYVDIQLPESLLELQIFLDKWSDEDLPQYDFLVKKLIEEIRPTSASEDTPIPVRSVDTIGLPKPSRLILDISIKKFKLISALLATLNTSYFMEGFLLSVEHAPTEDFHSFTDSSLYPVKTTFMGSIASHYLLLTSAGLSSLSLPTASFNGSVRQMARRTNSFGSLQVLHAEQPALQASQSTEINCRLHLGVFEGHFTVDLMDKLVRTQSLLGAEINDIAELALFYARKKASKSAPSDPSSRPEESSISDSVLFDVQLLADGINIATSSPDSTLSFYSGVLSAAATNARGSSGSDVSAPDSSDAQVRITHLRWKAAANGLAFALRPNDALDSSSETSPTDPTSDESSIPHQHLTVAYVLLDVAAQNTIPASANFAGLDDFIENDTLLPLAVRINRIRSVMHPIAIGRIVDVILFFSDELEKRKSAQAKEIEAIKQNAERFFSSIGSTRPDVPRPSFLETSRIMVSINHFGVSILLDEEETGVAVADGRPEGRQGLYLDPEGESVPALLISIRQVTFSALGFVKNRGQVQDLSFQFVTNFDQLSEFSFQAASYLPRNRLALQDISGSVYQLIKDGSGRVSVVAAIRGFQVDVDAQLADFINAILAVYSSGLSRFESIMPKSSAPPVPAEADPMSRTEVQFDCDLRFVEGVWKVSSRRRNGSVTPMANGSKGARQMSVISDATSSGVGPTPRRLLGAEAQPRPFPSVPGYERSRQTSHFSFLDSETGEAAAEDYSDQVMHLPGLTSKLEGCLVFLGYNLVGQHSVSDSDDSKKRRVHLTTIIHPSENTVHPSILLFVSDMLARVKFPTAPGGAGDKISSAATPSDNKGSFVPQEVLDRSSQYSLTYSLQLQETKVSLSCLPVSKVVFNYVVQQADMLASYTPPSAPSNGTEKSSATAVVSFSLQKLSGALRHAFSPEDCLNAEIPEFSLSVGLVATKDCMPICRGLMDDSASRSIQVVMDLPTVKAALNMRHLQDFFLFQRLWTMPSTSPLREYPTASSSARDGQTGRTDSPIVTASRFLPTIGLIEATLTTSEEHVGPPMSAKSQLLGFLDGLHTAISVKSFLLAVDVGQAIGKTVAAIDSLMLSGDVFPQEKGTLLSPVRRVRGSIGSIKLVSEGRFSGDALAERLSVSAEILPSGTRVDGRITRIELQLQYQYERILIAEVIPVSIQLVETWSPELVSVISTTFLLTIDNCRAIVSRRTVPTFLHMMQTIVALIEEKRNTDTSSPMPSPMLPNALLHGSKGLTSMPEVSSAGVHTGDELKGLTSQAEKSKLPTDNVLPRSNSRSSEDEDHATKTSLLEQIRAATGSSCKSLKVLVDVKALQAVLMRYNFRDPECGIATAKAVKLGMEIDFTGGTDVGAAATPGAGPAPLTGYVVGPAAVATSAQKVPPPVAPVTTVGGDESAESAQPSASSKPPRKNRPQSTTTAVIGGLALTKCTARTITPTEERGWTMVEWFAFLGSSPSRVIVAVPAVSVNLKVEEWVRLAMGSKGSSSAGLKNVASSVGSLATLGVLAASNPDNGGSGAKGTTSASASLPPTVPVGGGGGGDAPAQSTLVQGRAGVEQVVEFWFRSDFGGPIDLALNFGLYKYLQDLVAFYQTALKSKRTGGAGAGLARRFGSDEEVVGNNSSIGEDGDDGGGAQDNADAAAAGRAERRISRISNASSGAAAVVGGGGGDGASNGSGTGENGGGEQRRGKRRRTKGRARVSGGGQRQELGGDRRKPDRRGLGVRGRCRRWG
ncbi:hypothetical protein DFJ73DRAFT_958096 [Zopfochytrium polystomum]|nr:hypothetical protein DFJ73DRAFT_958096 [Zopfochytrium polystomum]